MRDGSLFKYDNQNAPFTANDVFPYACYDVFGEVHYNYNCITVLCRPDIVFEWKYVSVGFKVFQYPSSQFFRY